MASADQLHTGELHCGRALVGSQAALVRHFSCLAEQRARLAQFVAHYGRPEAAGNWADDENDAKDGADGGDAADAPSPRKRASVGEEHDAEPAAAARPAGAGSTAGSASARVGDGCNGRGRSGGARDPVLHSFVRGVEGVLELQTNALQQLLNGVQRLQPTAHGGANGAAGNGAFGMVAGGGGTGGAALGGGGAPPRLSLLELDARCRVIEMQLQVRCSKKMVAVVAAPALVLLISTGGVRSSPPPTIA